MRYDVYKQRQMELAGCTLAKAAKALGVDRDEVIGRIEEHGRIDVEDRTVVEQGTELEPERTGGVVPQKYKARYAERGNHRGCGDWLHQWLEANTLRDGKLDVPTFDALCALNGVELGKYNRTNNGWQGRLRMTGRILLRSAILKGDGKLQVPGAKPVQAPREWIAANSK